MKSPFDQGTSLNVFSEPTVIRHCPLALQDLGQTVGAMTKVQMSHLRELAQKLQGKPVLLLGALASDTSRRRGAAAMLASLRGGSDISLLSELSDQQQPGPRQMLLHQVRPWLSHRV